MQLSSFHITDMTVTSLIESLLFRSFNFLSVGEDRKGKRLRSCRFQLGSVVLSYFFLRIAEKSRSLHIV